MSVATQHAKTFLSDMQRLLGKSEFVKLSRYNEERNWSAYLSLKECHYCSILEWLLSPNEGHGLGDFFLKRLLLAASTTALADPDSAMASRFAARLEAEEWLGIDQVFTHSMQAALIACEIVSTDDLTRIDLLVVDPILRLVVAVERKDGSSVRANQLKGYQRWVKAHYPNYYQLFILSDSQGLMHQFNDAIDWIQLDDSWLVDALKEALIPGRLPTDVHQRMEDLLYRFDTEGEYRDPYFAGIEGELDEFVSDNRDVIQRLRNNPISHIDPRSFITSYLPGLDDTGDEITRRAMVLACRHRALLSDLLARDSFIALSDKLAALSAASPLGFESNDEALYIGTKRMEAAYEAGTISEWPVYVTLRMPSPGISKGETANQAPKTPTLSLTFDMLAMGEDKKDQARQLAKDFGLTPKRRWASKRVELPSEAEILDSPSHLKPWIGDLCALAARLGY